jgi:hypothetical protein
LWVERNINIFIFLCEFFEKNEDMYTWHAIVHSHYFYIENSKGNKFLFAAGVPMQKTLQGISRIMPVS